MRLSLRREHPPPPAPREPEAEATWEEATWEERDTIQSSVTWAEWKAIACILPLLAKDKVPSSCVSPMRVCCGTSVMKGTNHTWVVRGQASYPDLRLCWVTLRKSLRLSGPLSSHLWNGGKYKPSQPGVQEGPRYGLASARPWGGALYNNDLICNWLIFLLRTTTINIPAGKQHAVTDKASRAALERMQGQARKLPGLTRLASASPPAGPELPCFVAL